MGEHGRRMLGLLRKILSALFIGIACAAIILCCHAIFGDMGTAVSLVVLFLGSMVPLEYRDGD